jgi:hypothetical protein
MPTDADNPGPPILFGLNLGGFELPHGTRHVRVTGPGPDKTIPARAPEGWAVELPANAQGSTYVVEFLGREGGVLPRVTEPIDNRHRW